MILVLGIGGASIPIGNFALGGIGLAGVVGVLLNLVLPRGEEAPAADSFGEEADPLGQEQPQGQQDP